MEEILQHLSASARKVIDKYDDSQVRTRVNKEAFKSMKEILNRTFGEDHNQIVPPDRDKVIASLHRYTPDTLKNLSAELVERLIQQAGNCYEVVVRMPHVQIKNSYGTRHDIYELYMRCTFNAEGRMVGGPEGIRGMVTPEEYDANYQHSHLPGFNPTNHQFTHFCTGNGPIRSVIEALGRKYSPPQFQMLCLHLQTLASWESLEGTPHRHINQIRRRSVEPVPSFTEPIARNIGNVLAKAILKMEKSSLKQLLKVEVTKRGVRVEATEDLELLLASLLKDRSLWVEQDATTKQAVGHSLVWKDPAGRYTGRGSGSRVGGSRQVQPQPFLIFKKEPIRLRLMDQSSNTTNTDYANPTITAAVCRRLSAVFTEAALKRKNTAAQGAPGNQPEAAEPDNPPVPQGEPR